MLSSQTKDPVNAAAMSRLIKHGMVYDVLGLLLVVLIETDCIVCIVGLTVESMLEIDQQKLAKLIRPVGFYNYKAKYIKQTASILMEQANAEGKVVADIPDTYEGLIALPGVGPKMATLVMDSAWNKYASSWL